MSLALVLLCSCTLLLEGTHSCGLTTHVEIGHMAATIYKDRHDISYKQLIMKHQDAFQAGNTYPDTYYNELCFNGKYHQVSEDTHWTGFINVTIQYIRDNYPPPWSYETEKLVVFMLGFISHQVADITWHSLGIRQGFIRTMAAVDFHGVYDTAHSAADLGGDIVNVFRGDYSYVRVDEWYYPVQHLAKIYKMYYKDANHVPTEVIEDCTSLMAMAVLGEQLSFHELYSSLPTKSPFLTQNLDSFFLGGMYDMALWTTDIWDNVIYILENGFSKNCTTPDNPLYIRCKGINDGGHVAGKESSRVALFEPSQKYFAYSLNTTIVSRYRTKHGVVFKPTPTTSKRLNSLRQKQSRRLKVGKRLGTAVKSPSTVISTHIPYSRLGHVILSADINGDGMDDLIVTAPMYSLYNDTDYEGRLFILYGSERGLPAGDHKIEDIANSTLHGPADSAGRFGSAVAVLDINLDGYNDIVVSSPNVGWRNLTYAGGLSLWYGNSKGVFSGKPSLVHTIAKPPLYNNEGVELFTEDIDGDGKKDLIVSSPFSPGPAGPQSGKICIMQSSKTFKFSTWKCIRGPGLGANTSWFGSSVLVAEIAKLGRVLLVGSPIYRRCALPSCQFSVNDTQSAGQVTMWKLPTLTLLREMNGSTEHEHFGSSLAVGYPYGRNETAVLAIGMDSIDVNGSLLGQQLLYKQLGGIALYNLSTLMSTLDPPSVLYGDREFSMFGSQTKFADLDGDGKDELVAGVPHFTDDPTDLIYGAEQGIIMVFGSHSRSFPTDDINSSVCGGSWMRPCTSKVASQLMSWDENKAHVGSRLAVLRSSKKMRGARVVVTALRSSHGARQSGAVLIF